MCMDSGLILSVLTFPCKMSIKVLTVRIGCKLISNSNCLLNYFHLVNITLYTMTSVSYTLEFAIIC